MLTRHTNELMSCLDQVADVGCAIMRKEQILVWYDQDRMTINIWRDIQEKWEEILEMLGEDISTPLLVGDSLGAWTFAWGEGLIVTEKSWFKNVRDLATRNKPESDPDTHEEPKLPRPKLAS